MGRYLEIGQRVFNCDYTDTDMMGYGIVMEIDGENKDSEIYDDTVILLEMENGVTENEAYGAQVYIIDQLLSDKIGETVCYEHAIVDYDYYMPSNDENYMLGELINYHPIK